MQAIEALHDGPFRRFSIPSVLHRQTGPCVDTLTLFRMILYHYFTTETNIASELDRFAISTTVSEQEEPID
jgi:hypothetical protein